MNGSAIRETGSGIEKQDIPAPGWQLQESGVTVNLYAVSFIDANHGFVVGDSSTILHTSDGGRTWIKQYGGQGEYLQGVSLSDARTGTAVGSGGLILRTTDGGEHWDSQESGTDQILWGVCFTDVDTGTAVGEYGTILRTTTGGSTWIEESQSAPTRFQLSQNYPNPVTASTTIPFALPKPEHVRLSVSDMLGRGVATLVDEWEEPGSYTVPFDAAGLPSGMYLYMLKAGSAVKTREMVVVSQGVGY